MIDKLDTFHSTRTGLLLFMVVELAVAYLFISLAIDKGSIWYYLLTLFFFVGGFCNGLRLVSTTGKNYGNR